MLLCLKEKSAAHKNGFEVLVLLVLVKAAASLDFEVSLCHDLKWPKHGLKLVISGLVTAIAQILVDLEYSMVQFEQYNATSTQIILYFSLCIIKFIGHSQTPT